MHFFTVPKDIVDPPLAAGKYYASDEAYAHMVMAGHVQSPIEKPRPFDVTSDWNGKRILVVRQGALGDILFTTPTLREIKRRWPDSILDFACFDRFKDVLKHNPDVTSVITNPVSVDAFDSYDAVIWLDDDLVQQNEESKKIHAVDLVLNHVGVDTEKKELRYVVTPEEHTAASIRFPRGTRRRIGIALSASSPTRTYPRDMTHALAGLALKKGYEVFYFGVPGETGSGKTNPPPHLLDLTRLDPELNLRQSVAVMTTCDGFVGPDSGLTHIAGALLIPTIALYGPFPADLRTSYAKSIFAITGHGGCTLAPCFHHARFGRGFFPLEGPCFKAKHCTELASIAPDRILAKLEQQMKESKETVMEERFFGGSEGQ